MDRLRDVMAGGLAFDVVAQREHDLRDRFVLQALLEGRQVQLVGSDAVDRRKTAMQHMVGPAIGRGPFDGHEVRDLLDDANGGRVTFDVHAYRAEFGLGEAAATAATTDGCGRRL